ncbi:MAG: hypothetical protein JOY77_13105 [Alphaproteobacteria bacterium]|nr:hypothetical protein [Alphaproteobacteria bacterium]
MVEILGYLIQVSTGRSQVAAHWLPVLAPERQELLGRVAALAEIARRTRVRLQPAPEPLPWALAVRR